MNKFLLLSKMEDAGDTFESISEFLSIHRTTFSSKLNGTRGGQFTQEEIKRIKERYNLTAKEVSDIFFNS